MLETIKTTYSTYSTVSAGGTHKDKNPKKDIFSMQCYLIEFLLQQISCIKVTTLTLLMPVINLIDKARLFKSYLCKCVGFLLIGETIP